MGEAFSQATGLVELKKENLEGRLPQGKSSEFGDLLAAEALAVMYSFANGLAFLLAPSATETTVEISAIRDMFFDRTAAHFSAHP